MSSLFYGQPHGAINADLITSRKREARTRRPATVLECRRYFGVFDAKESLVAQVWFDPTDKAKDIARRRAHAIRQMIDEE